MFVGKGPCITSCSAHLAGTFWFAICLARRVLPPEAKMLSSCVWEQVLEQWREVILRQHWTDDYKIVVHGGDGRALDVNRHVSP
jgi:hypothetical protein